eukprot:364599-Chlamydomonas_euryale.AAC.6
MTRCDRLTGRCHGSAATSPNCDTACTAAQRRSRVHGATAWRSGRLPVRRASTYLPLFTLKLHVERADLSRRSATLGRPCPPDAGATGSHASQATATPRLIKSERTRQPGRGIQSDASTQSNRLLSQAPRLLLKNEAHTYVTSPVVPARAAMAAV